ncbi:MAG: helix-turn-helix domain-containing protein [Desulfobacterales bacterium]
MKRYLRLRELAGKLVTVRTVRNWCQHGGLPKYRVPGSNLIYFDPEDLEKFFIPVNAKEEINAMAE